MDQNGDAELRELLKKAKCIAKRYHELTGRSLGITGEVAEYEAAEILKGVELCAVRTAGHDAVCGNEHLQIKGRRRLPRQKSHQLGAINRDSDWDAVVLVLLDEKYEAEAIYKASRDEVLDALGPEGPKARGRGVLSVAKFIEIGEKVWQKSSPATRARS